MINTKMITFDEVTYVHKLLVINIQEARYLGVICKKKGYLDESIKGRKKHQRKIRISKKSKFQ